MNSVFLFHQPYFTLAYLLVRERQNMGLVDSSVPKPPSVGQKQSKRHGNKQRQQRKRVGHKHRHQRKNRLNSQRKSSTPQYQPVPSSAPHCIRNKPVGGGGRREAPERRRILTKQGVGVALVLEHQEGNHDWDRVFHQRFQGMCRH